MDDALRRQVGVTSLVIKIKEDHDYKLVVLSSHHVRKDSSSEDIVLSIEEIIKGLKKWLIR